MTSLYVGEASSWHYYITILSQIYRRSVHTTLKHSVPDLLAPRAGFIVCSLILNDAAANQQPGEMNNAPGLATIVRQASCEIIIIMFMLQS